MRTWGPDGVRTQNINLVIPALGTVTGNGTINPGGALNYKMTASLSGGSVSGLTQLAGMGGKGGSIPFFIQGTTSDPKFVPDMQGMVGSQLKGGLGGTLGGLTGKNPSGNSPVDALGGLFGKKKKQLGRRSSGVGLRNLGLSCRAWKRKLRRCVKQPLCRKTLIDKLVWPYPLP